MKIANHHDKQLTPLEICDHDRFLSHGFGYHHIKSVRLKNVQLCGHQIRVNTWTGAYQIEASLPGHLV